MIRDCENEDFDAVLAIVNDAAEAYRGIIPADRWHDPYMSADHLQGEIAAGVRFRGLDRDGVLVGVMGLQDVADGISLIRHAYVRTDVRRGGIGGLLMDDWKTRCARPMLVGTWAAATWAVAFYERHGFTNLDAAAAARLLHRHWDIPERQVETSVVLADARFLERFPSP